MMGRGYLGKSARFIKRAASPIWPDRLRRALNLALGSGRDVLYVHSGLSSIGFFLGGVAWVPSVLHEFCGTLFQPTHTYCYPASPTELAPIYDSKTTPSEMGLLAETFRQQPGIVRSIHSSHSIAASGPLAEKICAKHYECETPCGRGTPYGSVVYLGASALMMGVSFRHYTPFYYAEDEAGSTFAYEPNTLVRLRFIDEHGVVQERLSRRHNFTPRRFYEAGDFLSEKGFVRKVPLGRSYLLFVPDMLRLHEFLVERVKRTPDFLRSICKAPLR
jgi:aminoglycoside 3-N-acetyltransferase